MAFEALGKASFSNGLAGVISAVCLGLSGAARGAAVY